MHLLSLFKHLLASSLASAALAAGNNNTNTLVPFKYEQFPIGTVKPLGWIKDQLELEASAFPGHMYDFYYNIRRSTWLGGDTEYNELHEAAPYWYNGVAPLAYLLDDARLKAQVNDFFDAVLERQQEDGWIGPETDVRDRGLWARFLFLNGMLSHISGDPSKTERAVDAYHRFFDLSLTMLRDNFTGLIVHDGDRFDDGGFIIARAHEYSTTLQWLYENHPRGKQAEMWEAMNLMWEGAKVGGRDWTTFFVDGVFPTDTSFRSSFEHGVNLAQGLRYPAQLYRMTKNPDHLVQSRNASRMVFEYQGAPSGTIMADEGLAGFHPNRGSELCIGVEVTYSESYKYRLFGENHYADQAELAMFNAVPGAISEDWWSHQYITEPNEAWAKNLSSTGPFWDVRSTALSYGQEPNFPCCAVNHPQGFPKFFVSSLTKRVSDGAILHQYLVPLTATVDLGNGSTASITASTKYPFGHTINYTISTTSPFTFLIRIPSWVETNTTYTITNNTKTAIQLTSDNLLSLTIPSGASNLTLHLGASPRLIHHPNNTISLYHGALHYALSIPHRTITKPAHFWNDSSATIPSPYTNPSSHDHDLLPTGPWAVAIDPRALVLHDESESAAPLGNPVFAAGASPVWFEVAAVNVSNWGVWEDVPDEPPAEVEVVGEPWTARLVPFAAAKVRMGVLPVVELEGMGKREAGSRG